jgi:hypothetical protein
MQYIRELKKNSGAKLRAVSRSLLIIFGLTVFLLVAWLPLYLILLTQHGADGISAIFTPGAQSIGEALASLLTSFTIFTSISGVSITIYFTAPERNEKSLLFSVLTFLTFAAGAIYVLFVSLLRPLTGTAASTFHIIMALVLLLVGLGSSSLAFAFAIPGKLSTTTNLVIAISVNLLVLVLNVVLFFR